MRINRNDQQGAFLIELSIILPLVLLLIFGALEFSRVFSDNHQAQFLSRVAGMDASRRCTTAVIIDALDETPSNSTPLQNCLDSIVQTTWNQANGVMPEMRIVLSLYRSDGTNVTRSMVRAYRPGTSGTGEFYTATSNGTYDTKYDATDVDTQFDAIDQTENLVIAETFVPFATRIPYVNSYFGGSGHVQYSVSVH